MYPKMYFRISVPPLITVSFFSIFSILNDELDINLNADGGTVTVQATTHDIVYSYLEQKNEGPEQQILIPRNCPIPIRKSHHLQSSDQGSITVKVFLKSTELMELAEVCMKIKPINIKHPGLLKKPQALCTLLTL